MVSNGAAIATPIVVAIMLAAWITGIFWADKHPEHRRAGRRGRYEVSGGEFQARDGGRQLMPIPERPPIPTAAEIAAGATIPVPREALTADEIQAAADAGARIPAAGPGDANAQSSETEPQQAGASRSVRLASALRCRRLPATA